MVEKSGRIGRSGSFWYLAKGNACSARTRERRGTRVIDMSGCGSEERGERQQRANRASQYLPIMCIFLLPPFVSFPHIADIACPSHDILHLLSSIPSPRPRSSPSPAPTSSSWDDIPSDLEDTFYLSGDKEVEAYQREKKRRWVDALREARVRERELEDQERGIEKAGPSKASSGWGHDDVVSLIPSQLRGSWMRR